MKTKQWHINCLKQVHTPQISRVGEVHQERASDQPRRASIVHHPELDLDPSLDQDQGNVEEPPPPEHHQHQCVVQCSVQCLLKCLLKCSKQCLVQCEGMATATAMRSARCVWCGVRCAAAPRSAARHEGGTPCTTLSSAFMGMGTYSSYLESVFLIFMGIGLRWGKLMRIIVVP